MINNKGEFDEIVKVVLIILFFIIALLAVGYIITKFVG